MALEQFKKWYGSRHDYQKRWQEKTGQKIVGHFCTYTPEEIFYAFDILPVRLMGSHELQNITDPHESDLPFVKQALESIGLPHCFFEFDVATPVGAFSLRVVEHSSTVIPQINF